MPQATGAKISAIEFINILFGRNRTKGLIYFSSLPNDRNDPTERGERRLLTRDPEELERFIAKHDKPKRGLFFCVGTVNGKRNKANVEEIPGVWADLDFKGVNHTLEEIRAALAKLKCLPSLVVRSGHGLHLYWLFGKGIHAQINAVRIENVLRALADHIGGDTQVCEIARLMRLPGTHNTKFDSWVEVVVEISTEAQYHLEELEEWLALAIGKPLLERRPVSGNDTPSTPGALPNTQHDNPFLAAAQILGIKPHVDVDALIAGMVVDPRPKGSNGHIREAQLSITASLLAAGTDPKEAMRIAVDASLAAAERAGVAWKRDVEERAWVWPMIKSWLKKHPQKRGGNNGEPSPAPKVSGGEPGRVPGGEPEYGQADRTSGVVDFRAEQAKRKAKPIKEDDPSQAKHIKLGKLVLTTINVRGEDLMLTPKGAYRYVDQLWKLENDKAIQAWLNTELETGAQSLNYKSNNKLIGEARAWILRQPALQRDVVFNAHGMVPTKSGLIDPRSGQVTAPKPEHYSTWRVIPEYDQSAKCPFWLQMLEDVFSDRTPEERALCVQLLQEILGAGLIDSRPKSLSRALILQGGSNYGKSGILDVMAGLFGDDYNTVPLSTLDGTHGLMPFAYRVPWVLHEAFDQTKWHMSSVVKAIISGDGVQINMKNGPLFQHRVTAPIFWGTNNPPQFKEATKAISNRIVILECKREFDDDKPVGAAVPAIDKGYAKPSLMVLATELPGILAWAVEGLRRALARGRFLLPAESKAAGENILLDSNIVAGFVADGIDFARNGRLSVADFWAAFGSWWIESRGETSSVPGRINVGKALKALSNPRIAVDEKQIRDMHTRYYAGIALNEEGLRLWKNAIKSEAFQFRDRLSDATKESGTPNDEIPAGWASKPMIQAMWRAHDKFSGNDRRGHDGSENMTKPGDDPSSTQPTDVKRKPRF